MADDYNRLAMFSAPADQVNMLAQQLPAGHPSNILRSLRDLIPQVQADDSSTMSGIYSRLGRTVTAIPRAGLETMANWLQGTHDPNAVRIGEDTIAPLGLFGMAGLGVKGAAGVRVAADNAKSSVPGTVVQGLDMSQEARLARAQDQGFDTTRTWHHGTDAEFDAFQARPAPPYSGGSTVPATWLTSSPRVAKDFAEAGGQPGRVIDTHIAAPNLEVVERGFRSPNWDTMDPILQRAREAGKDGVLFKRSNDHPDSMVVDPRVWNASDVVAMFNPSNIRSTQAAFDPANVGKNGLLLSDGAKSSVPGTVVNAMGEQPQTIRAYHGTNAKFDRFDPSYTDEVGFHFGSKEQAEARLRDKADEEGRRRLPWPLSNERTIPVDIEAKKILDLKEDPNSFGGDLLSLRMLLDEHMPRSKYDEVQGMVRAGRDADATAAVRQWIVDNGYDVVRYPNKVEGVGAQPSYMTMGTGNVRDVKTGKVLFSASASAPGAAASASQPPQDDGVTEILRRYGLIGQ